MNKLGFSVVVKIARVVKGEHIVYCYGADASGRRIVWVDSPVRTEADLLVQGHEIIEYSGEYGAWGDGSSE